ncbi:coniferyl aldehyde dehydrogenase [Hyphobacterium sp.]|uniref:coniferyl aldehyde dehydrogenase n=1 Tax=Hyphobacterium sp. TaxID=2004662 RepID=UPI003BAC0BAE
MSDTDTKEIERMNQLFAAQKAAFETDRHRAYEDRLRDIDAIASLNAKHKDAIKDAAAADFGVRSRCETQLSEISYMRTAAEHTRRQLWSWMQKKKVSIPGNLKPGKAYIRREPIGVVGIISPWNYPYQLAFSPILAALAAGCRVMLKPSEYTPNMSELMKSMLAEEFDEDHVAVVLGGPDVGQAFTTIAFDHLLYTGSTQVGRLVAKAAAENLTPVTLELGGKSPVIVADDFPSEKAGETLAFGKFMNAGQTCIAPDYVLAPEGRSRTIADSIIARVQKAYPDWATDEDYTAIVSDKHYERLNGLIEEARAGGAEILQAEGGDPGNARKIAPTVVLNPPEDSGLMQEEIFGPVLPIVEHNGLEDAMKRVNARDRPLALYVYSKNKKTARSVIEGTISGGTVINNTMLHYAVEDLPFGGVGASGYGAYHGEAGFETFTHARAVFEAPVWHPSRLIQPPYGKIFDAVANK